MGSRRELALSVEGDSRRELALSVEGAATCQSAHSGGWRADGDISHNTQTVVYTDLYTVHTVPYVYNVYFVVSKDTCKPVMSGLASPSRVTEVNITAVTILQLSEANITTVTILQPAGLNGRLAEIGIPFPPN